MNVAPVQGRAAADVLPRKFEWSLEVLDLIYVVGVIVLFAIVGLIGKAVEKL